MIAVCALVFASVCIPQSDLAVTMTGSMYDRTNPTFDQTTADRRGMTIGIFESDQINLTNSLFIDRACAQGWCIHYKRHCDAAMRDCDFTFDAPMREADYGAAGLRLSIKIHARSKQIMIRTMRGLSIALGGEPAVAYLPLIRLDREEASGSEGHCSRVVWFEGCDRPPLPGLPRPARL